MRISLLLVTLVACGGAKNNAPAQATSTAEASGETVGLHGAPVAPPRPVTAFEGVVAHGGQPRSLDALKGHPTVVWFFPFAGTPG